MVRTTALVVIFAFFSAMQAQAASAAKGQAKAAVDRTADYLIEHYDVKKKEFTIPELNADPAFWAIYVTALCEHRHDYKETNGPFISEPVHILVKKIKDDGTVKGAKHPALAAYLAAQALSATKNPKYQPLIDKLKANAKGPAPAALKTAADFESIPLDNDWLLAVAAACREMAETGAKEVTIDGKPLNWAEAVVTGLLKKGQRNGSYTGNLRTDALVLQVLNVCYQQL